MASVLTNSPSKIIPNIIIGSPVRPLRFNMTPMSPVSPGLGEFYPWKWHESARNVEFSPASTCSSPRTPGSECTIPSPRTRGRPRAETIPELQREGVTLPVESPNGIKCRVCSRVFPREKSLQAHMRTHTGKLSDWNTYCPLNFQHVRQCVASKICLSCYSIPIQNF